MRLSTTHPLEAAVDVLRGVLVRVLRRRKHIYPIRILGLVLVYNLCILRMSWCSSELVASIS